MNYVHYEDRTTVTITRASIEPDAYLIGYGPIFQYVQAPWRLWRSGHKRSEVASFVFRRSSDRWRRCWQAEWVGCQRAPRAWTRRGVIRKAKRWIAAAPSGEQ